MRISDWSSDVCSSDLVANGHGGYDVTIKQDQKQAVLSWDTFNIGEDTSLTFDQKGNADWIALNRVVGQLDPFTGRRDPSKAPAPSQILGSMTADGAVIVINQNCILFGAGSPHNFRGLSTTSLKLGTQRLPVTNQSVDVNAL